MFKAVSMFIKNFEVIMTEAILFTFVFFIVFVNTFSVFHAFISAALVVLLILAVSAFVLMICNLVVRLTQNLKGID